MWRLENRIQPYAWGSTTALSELLGRAPTGAPEAELWLGAHPSAPSIAEGAGALDALVAANPLRTLGHATASRSGGTLPFLLKVLAVEQPLSLQAHPSKAQAEAGFAREEAAGMPRAAPTRSYKDANHKPELVCALTPFDALCGFRPAADTARLLRGLDVPALRVHLGALEGGAAGALERLFRWVLTLPHGERTSLVQAVGAAVEREVAGFEKELLWARRLARAYPSDVGLVGALLLNLLTLEPGQALYLPAGNLHAYLHGTAVELMANSDNVLRGGLTPKHVDVDELLRVLVFDAAPARVLRPSVGREQVYAAPIWDFRLSKLELTHAAPLTVERWSADLLFCVQGEVAVRCGDQTLSLHRGQSVFLAADEGPAALSGAGAVFRATVNAEASE